MVYLLNSVSRLGDGKEYLFQAKDEVRCTRQNNSTSIDKKKQMMFV